MQFYLKKKIIGLESNFMSENEIEHSKSWPKRVGYLHLNTISDYGFDSKELQIKMNEKIKNYDNFINSYHCFNPNKTGNEEIIETIKKRFF